MQAFVCNSEDGSLPDGMMAIQVSTSPSGRSGSSTSSSRACLSAVELGKRLLVYARDGDTDEVKNLISRGAPFTTDWLGTSPLHLAAMNGHTETAEVLLRGGISRDCRTKVDRTPLHIAAQEGHADIVEILLNHGAEIESVDMLKMTPLHWAVDRGHTDTVLKLLEHGANPNAVSKFDKTPIILALDNSRADLLEMLQNSSMYNVQKEGDEQFLSQIEEAGSAAENLMVISGNHGVEEEEEVQTSESTVITVDKQGDSSVWCDSTEAETSQFELTSDGIKINFLNSSEKASTAKSKSKPVVVAGTSGSTAQHNIQFLKEHGITMLPVDDSNIVASAMESGQTVVLTEAGKLALNLTRGTASSSKKIVATSSGSSGSPAKNTRKVVAISAEQLAMLTGKVTKVVPVNKKLSFSPARLRVKNSGEGHSATKIITTTTGKRIFPSTPPVIARSTSQTKDLPEKIEERLDEEEMEGVALEEVGQEEQDPLDDRPTPEDLETMARKLAQAKKEAEEYRKQLLQKEQEAEEYMQKLKSLTK